jgi:hypothetical protein
LGECSEQLIQDVAQWLDRRRLALPAMLFLEIIRPLSFIASQCVLLGQPLLGLLYPERQIQGIADLMADRASLDRLIACLERAGPVPCGAGKEES